MDHKDVCFSISFQHIIFLTLAGHVPFEVLRVFWKRNSPPPSFPPPPPIATPLVITIIGNMNESYLCTKFCFNTIGLSQNGGPISFGSLIYSISDRMRMFLKVLLCIQPFQVILTLIKGHYQVRNKLWAPCEFVNM